MKLTKRVSVILKEDKRLFSQKLGHNFIVDNMYHVSRHIYTYANLRLFTFHCVVCERVTEHVIYYVERNILHRRGNIF